jgi:serine/threonine-protein kinase
MLTSDLPSADVFVTALTEHGLLTPTRLERVQGWRLASPGAGADDLANFLVEEEYLTRFQADVFLEGDPKNLQLAGYTLVDVLGNGSMGTVYKAKSSKDDNWYAVKVVPRRNVINLKSIAEKIEALKQVRHPRVSSMVHVGAQGDRAYVVWPMIEGGEKLDAAIKRLGKLPARQAAQIVLQIASGLQAYHDHDLFHGLLKPSDVIIGLDRRVRLLDFGIGFLLTCDRGKALLDTMTNSKALARGLDCASPEAILDPLNRTVLGDQYSLGCILYFCLTGRYPFTESNPVKKMLAHQCHEPTPIRQLVPDCPAKMAAIVHKLLMKQPDERYRCIGDLIAELQTVTSDSRRPAAAPARTTAPVKPSAKQRQQAEEQDRLDEEESPASAQETMKNNSRAVIWLTLGGMAAGGVGGVIAWWLAHH